MIKNYINILEQFIVLIAALCVMLQRESITEMLIFCIPYQFLFNEHAIMRMIVITMREDKLVLQEKWWWLLWSLSSPKKRENDDDNVVHFV